MSSAQHRRKSRSKKLLLDSWGAWVDTNPSASAKIAWVRDTAGPGARKKGFARLLVFVLIKLNSVPIMLANLGESFSCCIKNRTVNISQYFLPAAA